MNNHSKDLQPSRTTDHAESLLAHGEDPQASFHAREGGQSPLARFLRGTFRLILPVLVIAAGGFAAWQLVATKPEVNRRPPSEQSYAVEVKRAIPAALQPDIILYGTVSAARQVELRALVSGEVVWVNPNLLEGHVIEQGAALIRIDPFEFEGAVREAEANLAEARASLSASEVSLASDEAGLARLEEQLTLGQKDLERAEQLAKSGSLTQQALENRRLTVSQRQQSVESRQFNLKVLASQIEQQKANLDRLEWRLEQARRNLANTTLSAPYRGVVQSKAVELGRSVSGNDTLVTLYDPDAMDVRFTLSDAQYGRLTSDGKALIGKAIKVNWLLGERTVAHKATVTRVTPEVNAANGGVEVFARLEAESELRTGTFVELLVPDKVYENAISIPQAAIYGGDRVYVNRDGRMAPVSVRVLAYLGDNALIDGTAFDPAMQIVTTRVAEAGPGLKLVVPGQSGEGFGKGQKVDQKMGQKMDLKKGAQMDPQAGQPVRPPQEKVEGREAQ
ncbi:efflux RND transporter periplasmic adaptor subunit [uncultured Cohaesibacter sp.]|uniref:efflux RND transporter periplasmic adaptor subunit n=1 Tax=uncultured Cohaesibacter sp. TaxID=1002546 RepID=UPI0029C8CC2F|nr:efflux RND transporter periplasmic adaptor subunit [uncultured Cohaesibacter sp.]